MRAAGIKRKDELFERLEEGMRRLVSLINEFSGLEARLIYPGYRDEFHLGIMVKAFGFENNFQAYISYENIEDKNLEVSINYSERPSTDEFPLENGLRVSSLPIFFSSIINFKSQFLKFL